MTIFPPISVLAGCLIKKQAAKYALGAACAPWVGTALTVGTLAYGGYKIAKFLTDKDTPDELSTGSNGKK